MTIKRLQKFHDTKAGIIIFGVVELGLAYWFLSLAINSAHTWEWALFVLFGLGVVHNAGLLILKLADEFKKEAERVERR